MLLALHCAQQQLGEVVAASMNCGRSCIGAVAGGLIRRCKEDEAGRHGACAEKARCASSKARGTGEWCSNETWKRAHSVGQAGGIPCTSLLSSAGGRPGASLPTSPHCTRLKQLSLRSAFRKLPVASSARTNRMQYTTSTKSIISG